MKTLKIALASFLVILSFNAFSETCNPCITAGNLLEDSIILYDGTTPHDTNVNEMLQQMTAAVNQQMMDANTLADAGKHKHNGRKSKP
jgi:hypothetical protein